MSDSPATVQQPRSIPNASAPIWDLVKVDIDERNAMGTAKYGTPVQVFNGREPAVDLYQELLDAVVYARQMIEECRILRARNIELEAIVKELEANRVQG